MRIECKMLSRIWFPVDKVANLGHTCNPSWRHPSDLPLDIQISEISSSGSTLWENLENTIRIMTSLKIQSVSANTSDWHPNNFGIVMGLLEIGGTSQESPHFSRVYPLSKTYPTSQNQRDSPKVGGLLESGWLLKSVPTLQNLPDFSKPGGLSKTGGTFGEWGDFSRVPPLLKSVPTLQNLPHFSKPGVLSKSGGTFGE